MLVRQWFDGTREACRSARAEGNPVGMVRRHISAARRLDQREGADGPHPGRSGTHAAPPSDAHRPRLFATGGVMPAPGPAGSSSLGPPVGRVCSSSRPVSQPSLNPSRHAVHASGTMARIRPPIVSAAAGKASAINCCGLTALTAARISVITVRTAPAPTHRSASFGRILRECSLDVSISKPALTAELPGLARLQYGPYSL